ncbi:MAG: hybrid sensor histidine kinase/response regulator [Myxococcales bacterium]|nr:hybrid sensor histidine kinase/response regulator [Myxococcales bacterium]
MFDTSAVERAIARARLSTPECRRVLVVDDELGNVMVIEALLETEFEVFTADSGLEALDVIRREGPMDLVLSDQRMPHMTGVELLSRIAQDSPETIRIILTAYTDVEPIVAAVNQGAVYRFLLKPWEPSALRAAVRDGLALRAARQLKRDALARLAVQRAEYRATLVEQERAQNLLIAADRFATLGKVTSGITHDINNQLSAMLFLTDALRSDEHSPRLRQAAEQATETLESLFLMLQDVNSFARMEGLEIARTTVDTQSFLRETLSLFHLEPGGTGVIVDCSQTEPYPETLHADGSRLRQAVLALLRNAATAIRGRGGRIWLSVVENGVGCCVTVQDDGLGMDEATRTRCIEPFFSAFNPPGPGLGLGIVALVAEAHGGRLEIESTPLGAGTTVRLHLRHATSPSLQPEMWG